MTDVEIVSHFPTNVFNYRKRLRSTTGESGAYVDPVVAFESKCETQLSETNPRQETIFSKALEPLSTAVCGIILIPSPLNSRSRPGVLSRI